MARVSTTFFEGLNTYGQLNPARLRQAGLWTATGSAAALFLRRSPKGRAKPGPSRIRPLRSGHLVRRSRPGCPRCRLEDLPGRKRIDRRLDEGLAGVAAALAEVDQRNRPEPEPSDAARRDLGGFLERVIEVMRRVDEAWYQRYINAPMGRKPIPVSEGAGAETATDTTVIAAASRAREDRWVAQSAEMLVEAIRLSVVAGREPPTDVVRRLLTTFREVSADAIGDTARSPCTAAAAADDAIMSLLSPERIERLIPQILDILGVADVAARDQQPRRTRIELDDIRRRGPSAASDRPSGAQRVA